uniref:Uncharacterized protein n=1 Tax=viral metagenome TaxID=1070528 RepID=A0A6C0CAT5_9ZZZZ
MEYANLFINQETFDVENIRYIKPISFPEGSRDMGIYYATPSKKGGKERKQKIIVETPKMYVPCAYKEFIHDSGKKYYKMCLSFSTLTNLYNEEEIQKFYDFAKKIDQNNIDIVDNYKKKWKLSPNLVYRPTVKNITENFPDVMDLNLPHNETDGFLFHVYNEKAEKSSLDIVTKQCIVSCILELTDLTFTKKAYRANWKVLQIRKSKNYSPIQEYFMSGCFICDKDDPDDVAYDNMMIEYKKKMDKKNQRLAITAALTSPDPMTNMMPMMQMMQQMMAGQPQAMPTAMQRGGPPPPPPPPMSKSKPAAPLPPPPKKTNPTGTIFSPPSETELLNAKKILRSVPPIEKKEFKSIYSESKAEAIDSDDKHKSEDNKKVEDKVKSDGKPVKKVEDKVKPNKKAEDKSESNEEPSKKGKVKSDEEPSKKGKVKSDQKQNKKVEDETSNKKTNKSKADEKSNKRTDKTKLK